MVHQMNRTAHIDQILCECVFGFFFSNESVSFGRSMFLLLCRRRKSQKRELTQNAFITPKKILIWVNFSKICKKNLVQWSNSGENDVKIDFQVFN